MIELKLPGTHVVHGVGKCGDHVVALHTVNIPGSFACGKILPEPDEQGNFEIRLGEHPNICGAVYDALGFMLFEMEDGEDPELGMAILYALESAITARATGEKYTVEGGSY